LQECGELKFKICQRNGYKAILTWENRWSSGFTHAHWHGWPLLSAKSDKMVQVISGKDKNNLMLPNLHY